MRKAYDHDRFDAGGILNRGSCVSNAHIHGAAIKKANIYAMRNLRGNYDADYIEQSGRVRRRMGRVLAFAIATGFNRFGFPSSVLMAQNIAGHISVAEMGNWVMMQEMHLKSE